MEPTLTLNAALTNAFEDKVMKLNRKAAKLGMPSVGYMYGKAFEALADAETVGAYTTTDADGRKRRVALYRPVFLSGEAPVIEGYEFVATVDLKGEKPMVNRQPFTAQDVDLTPFFHTDGHCDHCNTVRRRNDVLIVREVATGNVMQVGRNCAADFFRSADAARMLACCDWVGAYGNVTDHDPKAEPYMTVRRLFETAAAVVRTFGWVNHKDTADTSVPSTRSRTLDNLFPWVGMRPDCVATVTDEDRAEAEVMLEWATRKFFHAEATSEFAHKVKAAVEDWNGVLMVRHKNLNMLAWMVGGYKRDLQKDAEKRMAAAARAKQASGSTHQGEVGTRTEFDLGVEFKRAFDGQYGMRYMVKMSDLDGNVFVWWGTNDFAADLNVGDRVKAKATVKAHDEYDVCAQTVLTRLSGEVMA